jgi:hypothetical protein
MGQDTIIFAGSADWLGFAQPNAVAIKSQATLSSVNGPLASAALKRLDAAEDR